MTYDAIEPKNSKVIFQDNDCWWDGIAKLQKKKKKKKNTAMRKLSRLCLPHITLTYYVFERSFDSDGESERKLLA